MTIKLQILGLAAALFLVPASAGAVTQVSLNFAGVATAGSQGRVVPYGGDPMSTRSFVGEPVSISLSLTKALDQFYVDQFTVSWSNDDDALPYLDQWSGFGVPLAPENESFLGFFSVVDLSSAGGSIQIFPTFYFSSYTDATFRLSLDFTPSGAYDPLAAFSGGVTGGGGLDAYVNLIVDPQVGPYDASSNVSFNLTSLTQRGVPEPASWAVMVIGLGAVGAAMRRTKRTLSASVRPIWGAE